MIDPVIIQARLAAAKHDTGVFAAAYREHVPELVRVAETLAGVLLSVEWEGSDDFDTCPECGDERHDRHDLGCGLDAALTLAGFPDQASRDAERERRTQSEQENRK